jgi:glucose-1-phosphate thymidylyltransferase
MPIAIDLAYDWVKDCTVIFGMPDTIIEPFDAFQQLLSAHQKTGNDVTLGLFETDSPSKFGMVEMNETNQVLSTVDKPSETILKHMWGCCCWEYSFTTLIHEYLEQNIGAKFEIVLGDIFNQAIMQNMKIGGLVFESGQYMDIGTSDELDKALKKFHL